MRFLKAISVFSLAFLVLVSSSSFRVGIHFCADKIHDVAIFDETEKCDMEKNLPPCHKNLKASCCDDETVVHEGDGFEVSFSDVAVSVVPVLDLDLPLVVVSEIIPDAPSSKISYYKY
ncbi:MAG TPA: hypothetical protein VFD46_06920, partial [Chryseolinea sp.]|nr:hypothetical protein [Chryseolinea sp.]